MRDLFDDKSGDLPVDPHESVRRLARGPRLKRFYTRATVGEETAAGFAVQLDGKPVLTPSRQALVAPSHAVAHAVAGEWNAQLEFIDPTTMPVTRLANSVIAAVADRVADVADDIGKYFQSDLLFYRAGHPDGLVVREAEHWDPVLFWAANTLGAHFILTEGVMHVTQPEQAVAAARNALPHDPWSVAALHVVTTLTGSALLALALLNGVRDVDQVWAAANVDEDWNAEQWGADEEAMTRRDARLRDLRAAALVLAAASAGEGVN